MQKKKKINKKAQSAGMRVQLQAVSHFYMMLIIQGQPF